MTTLSDPKNPPIELTISSDVFNSLPRQLKAIATILEKLNKVSIERKEERDGQ